MKLTKIDYVKMRSRLDLLFGLAAPVTFMHFMLITSPEENQGGNFVYGIFFPYILLSTALAGAYIILALYSAHRFRQKFNFPYVHLAIAVVTVCLHAWYVINHL